MSISQSRAKAEPNTSAVNPCRSRAVTRTREYYRVTLPLLLSTEEPIKTCISPDGLEGKCVFLLECRTILQLLKRKPIPQEIIMYGFIT